MFVLTCPSCNHASRVRYARFHAVATCPGCNARFRVDEKTSSIDRDGSVTGPVHDLEQVVPTPSELKVRGGPDPSAFATRRGEEDPAAEEMWDEVFGEAPPVRTPVVHEAPLDWKPRRRRFTIPERVPAAIVGMLMLGSALAAGVIVGAIRGGAEPVERIVEVPVGEPIDGGQNAGEGGGGEQVADSGTTSPEQGSSAGSGGGGQATSTEGGGEPVAVGGGDTTQGGSSSQADAGTATSGGPAGGGTTGGGTQTASRQESSLPEMELQRSIAYEPRWETLREPRRPMHPMPQSDVLLWLPRLQRDEESGRTMFTAMFLSESEKIYQSGFLHVQLLDEQGQAFAELKQVVPALNARQGLQVRLMVPEELESQSSRVVAQFTPVDPLPRAAPIEAVNSMTRVNDSADGPVIELTIVNPNSEPVTDPEVVVELLTRDGWPVGMYRGTVKGTIEPGKPFVFLLRPPLEPLADADAEPGRVEIRGYAFRQ